MAGFGSMGGGVAGQGLALLNQIRGMQNPAGGSPAAPAPAAFEGAPDFINNGLIGRVMSGNPGGLIGALMKAQNAPVNPGAPPVAGSPDYFPGGQGPMAGGAPAGGGMGLMDMLKGGGGGMGGLGMLGKMLQGR